MKNVMTKIMVGALIIAVVGAVTIGATNEANAHSRESRRVIQSNVYGDNYYYEINRRYVIHDYSNCVKEYYTKLSERTRVVESCKITQPLRLAWTTKNYPYLRENPRRVQFWEGEASKVIAVDERYKRELVDNCRGKILSEGVFTETYKAEKKFAVVNANLDDNITESFMLVPITEQEAKQELSEALLRCQK